RLGLVGLRNVDEAVLDVGLVGLVTEDELHLDQVDDTLELAGLAGGQGADGWQRVGRAEQLLLHLLDAAEEVCPHAVELVEVEDALGRGGLARVDVRDDANVANVLEHGCRATGSLWRDSWKKAGEPACRTQFPLRLAPPIR